MASALLTVVALAAVMGGFLMTTQAANMSGATDANAVSTTSETANGNYADFPSWNNGGMGLGEPKFRTGPRPRHRERFGGFGPIEVSAEFEQKVIDIANSDADVQALLAEGYNITSIRPVIKSVVDANGDVTTKATGTIVMLQKDTTGCASVFVDLEAGKVTRIVILTRTVIEK